MRILQKFFLLTLVLFTAQLNAQSYYMGILGGLGDTNWSRITTNDPNSSLNNVMPAHSVSNGFTWGLFAGTDFNDHFGAELRYQHYANSSVDFLPGNVYPVSNFDALSLNSTTQNVEFLAKLLAPISAQWTSYAVFGGSYTMRDDVLGSPRGIGGVFGGGMSFRSSEHFNNSIEFDFVTGNVPLNQYPAQDYLPFITSLAYKLSYYF